MAYVTYAELFALMIVIVSIIDLVIKIDRKKK